MVLQQSVGTLLKFAVIPIAKVLVMCGLGLLLASSYINILPAPARKQLSKLVFSLFLPCLIFTQLGKSVTIEKILEWWFIPVNVIVASLLGCCLGYAIALLVKPPPQFFNFTVVMIGIGNIGNIPLVIIGAVCRDKGNPFGDPDSCNSNGVAYISFGQWVGAVIVYTYVFQMLAPPSATRSHIMDSEIPGESVALTVQRIDYSSESVLLHPDYTEEDSLSVPLLVPRSSAAIHMAMARLRNSLSHTRFEDIFQPPVVASLLSLVFGATPILRNLIFTEHSIFFFLYDSLNILGGAMVPCIMLALGGNLVGGPGSSELGLRTTMAITFARLLLVPPIGLAVVMSADKLGFLPADDKMFRFVLLLQHTMPTSILAGAVANLQGHAEKEASAILFWEHILAVFSMAGWLILYVNVLF
ncbi:unnamed protein product [Sphagnum compactum]